VDVPGGECLKAPGRACLRAFQAVRVWGTREELESEREEGVTVTDKKAMDKLKGKAKEATGKVTGDRRKEAEGKSDQAKAKTEETLGATGDRAKGMKDSLTDDDR